MAATTSSMRLAQTLGLLGDGDVRIVFRARFDATGTHTGGMPSRDDGAMMMRGHG